MILKKNIILVGMTGVGKTTVVEEVYQKNIKKELYRY